MKIRDICVYLVSELRITFDEDPNDGHIDVIIPVTADARDILGDSILEMDVHSIKADGDAIIISTFTR